MRRRARLSDATIAVRIPRPPNGLRMTQPLSTPDLQSTESPRRRGLRSWVAAVVVAAGFFAAVAPTLTRLEFVGGSEVLVVETALEMRRGGPWFIPTLQGYPRLTK